MPLLDRIFTGDEELGKKDDDHRPKKGAALPSSWVSRPSIPAIRRRRVFYGIAALLLLYLFIHNIPTDLGPSSQRPNFRSLGDDSLTVPRQDPPSGQPPRPQKPLEAEEHYYDGPIKFYKLAVSLQAAARRFSHYSVNKNVLFAASNLKSASEILPLACEMARWKRNDVHFALMGRDDLDIPEIKELNGISDDDCHVRWHGRRARGEMCFRN